jgi:hypothetical protein
MRKKFLKNLSKSMGRSSGEEVTFPYEDLIYMPYGSDREKHFLIWYDYDVGFNGIISNSVPGLLALVDGVLQRENIASCEIKKYFRGKIVNAPHQALQTIHNHRRETACRTETFSMLSQLRRYVQITGSYPDNVVLCDNFQPPDSWDVDDWNYHWERVKEGPGEYTSVFEFRQSIHDSCTSCHMTGIASAGGKSLRAWAEERVLSPDLHLDYPDHTPTVNTYVIHSSGYGIKVDSYAHLAPDFQDTHILCFFEGEFLEPPQEIVDHLAAKKEKYTRERLSSQRDYAQEAIDRTLQQFSEPNLPFAVDMAKLEEGLRKEYIRECEEAEMWEKEASCDSILVKV